MTLRAMLFCLDWNVYGLGFLSNNNYELPSFVWDQVMECAFSTPYLSVVLKELIKLSNKG